MSSGTMKDETYVVLGDSTGVGFGDESGKGYAGHIHARLRATRPSMRLVNLAMCGARIADVRVRQLTRVPATPTVVSLAVGANDVVHRTPERAFFADFDRAAAHLAELGAPVILSNIPDLSRAPIASFVARGWYEERLTTFNDHVATVARKHGFQLCDLYGMSTTTTPDLHFCPDGFHPSAEGYAALAKAMWPHVESAATRKPQAALQPA